METSIRKRSGSVKEKNCSSHLFLLITLLFPLNNEGQSLGSGRCVAVCSVKSHLETWPHAQVI